MMKEVHVGVLGFGTVGAGVVEGILVHRDVMRARAGVDLVVRKIADLDVTTSRGFALPEGLLTTDAESVVSDPDIQIVVETIGGTGIARKLVLAALRNRKCVVTANKKLLAEHGREIFDTAEEMGVEIYFGASVGGGIPIIRVLREGLVANEIESIQGILNGTCNYILTRMAREGASFDDVLKDAQRLGYAEADPSLDIDGLDTAHKACILAALAYGFHPSFPDVQVEGIRSLSGVDVRYADELGYAIKLLALVAKDGDAVEVGVHPTLIPKAHMLASVNGSFNAAMVKGDMSDETLYYGRGAGRAPTAATVVGDVVSLAKSLAQGAPRFARGVPVYNEGRVHLKAPGEIVSKFYVRFMVADRPGAFGTIATILGSHGVSIAGAMQKESGENGFVPVVALLHEAKTENLERALDEIVATGVVGVSPVKLRML